MEINVNGNVTINVGAEKVSTAQSNNPEIEEVKECSFQLAPEATLNELLEVLGSNPEVLASAANEAADRADEENEARLHALYGDDYLQLVDRRDHLHLKKRRPGAIRLRRIGSRIAKRDLGSQGMCEVFSNGYAIYDNGDRRTVLWVPDCTSRRYFFDRLNDNQKEYLRETDEVGEDVLGECPWYMALMLAGEHCIEANMAHPKSVGVASIFDRMECDVEKAYRWVGGARFENPEEAYLRKEAAEERRRALTDKQYEACVMSYEYEMTHREIGKELGISHMSVWCRLNSAKSIFKNNPEKFFSVDLPKRP